MTSTKKVAPVGVEPAAKSKTPMIVAAILMLLAVIAVAVAVPLALANKSDDKKPETPQVKYSFVGSGAPSDYDESTKTSLLDAMAIAAGFTSTPEGSVITLTAASVKFECFFPVASAEEAAAASATLSSTVGTKVALQSLLTTQLGAAAPVVEEEPALTISGVASPPPTPPSTPPPPSPSPGPPPSPAPPPPLPANEGPFSSGCQAIPLAGRWIGNYGTSFVVNNTMWLQVASWGVSHYTVTEFSATHIIMQNPADDAYNPNKWSKVQFHANGDGTHSFCMTIYNAQTESDAKTLDTSSMYNATNAASGCNGFGFSIMTKDSNPVVGKWLSNYGTKFSITNDYWYETSEWGDSYYTILVHTSDYVIMQNPADDSYNPSSWTKVEYHSITTEGFAFCKSVYNGASWTAAHSLDTTSIYNKSDASSGCNGFSFTTTTSFSF